MFPSKIYTIFKDQNNMDFFNQITDDSDKSIVVYVEHKNGDYKQMIDPSVSSQRTLRKWLRNIESEFAEKVIDKKIEELDKVINQ